MTTRAQLLEALARFNDRYERCHMELSSEIQISELKIKQFHYLEIISKNSYLTFSRFAEILGISKPSVTSIVNQLIRLECVRKSQCSQDGRRFYIELSSKGEKIASFNELKRRRLAETIMSALTERETEFFISLIKKIANI